MESSKTSSRTVLFVDFTFHWRSFIDWSSLFMLLWEHSIRKALSSLWHFRYFFWFMFVWTLRLPMFIRITEPFSFTLRLFVFCWWRISTETWNKRRKSKSKRKYLRLRSSNSFWSSFALRFQFWFSSMRSGKSSESGDGEPKGESLSLINIDQLNNLGHIFHDFPKLLFFLS